MIPQTNATLTQIARGGASEDYDTAAGGGSSIVWQGISRCYVGVRSATVTEGNLLNQTKVTYAVVDGAVWKDFAPGDVLTIDGATHKVREVRNRQVDTLPPQPVRLDLEDE